MSLCKQYQLSSSMVALSICLIAPTLSAAPTVLTPAADTFITVHPSLGDKNSNHGADNTLYVIGPNVGNEVVTNSLVRFDLSAFAGQTVQGNATFSMHVQGTNFNNPTAANRNIVVKDIVSSWNEATATWNSSAFVAGGLVASQVIHYLTSADDAYISWTLPQSYVQNWIDNPSSNLGLYIQNPTGGPINDLQFGSRESVNPPLLSLTVPEPAALSMLSLAGVGLMRRARNRT